MNLYKQDMSALVTTVRPLRSIAEELRSALNGSDQFAIRYQPVIDATTKKVAFAEALLRWTSPVLGEVLPGRFISIAEQNGLIRQITGMVLRKVCADVAAFPGLVVSVNVSRTDITDPAFPDEVRQILSDHGVLPKQVILECTDSLTPEAAGDAAATVSTLRRRGHAVAIYEMETGFTSFGFLTVSDSTVLKIDRVLLDEALQNDLSRQNLQEALDDSKAKGFKSLAFGVETQDQAELVAEMGFDLQQGFYHSLSLSLDELMDFSGRPPLRLAVNDD